MEIMDMTGQRLHDNLVGLGLRSGPPGDGAFLFHGKSIDEIIHVRICGPNGICIEAGGAGRYTAKLKGEKLLEYCTRKDARVRYKKLTHRTDIVSSIPFEYRREFDGKILK